MPLSDYVPDSRDFESVISDVSTLRLTSSTAGNSLFSVFHWECSIADQLRAVEDDDSRILASIEEMMKIWLGRRRFVPETWLYRKKARTSWMGGHGEWIVELGNDGTIVIRSYWVCKTAPNCKQIFTADATTFTKDH